MTAAFAIGMGRYALAKAVDYARTAGLEGSPSAPTRPSPTPSPRRTSSSNWPA